MRPSGSPLSVLAVASFLLGSASAALDPIVIKGSKFFYQSSGTQFYIKGVAYQQGVSNNGGGSTSTTGYTDPLANATACARDVPLLQKLGTNLIRTYAIDPTQDHSQCMTLLAAAGIYVISDLSQPNLSINRETPAWDTTLYQRYTDVVDELQKYSNVIGFFAGNEVTSNTTYTQASAFVKAAVRDTKAYIKAKGYHSMGVGYAADDDSSIRANVADYFNCAQPSDTIDFWGYNIYEWCGDSDYVTSGYINRVAEFANYTVPVFFAEYGCNTQGGGAAGRKFTEVGALYGSNMTQVFSGGIVYEYFEEENDYGLVSIVSASASPLPDYSALSSQLAAVTPSAVNSASYTPTNTVQASCPSIVTGTWAASSVLPPTPNKDLCACMVASLTCVAKSSLSADDIGTLFGQVCTTAKTCVGIAADATGGNYGAYSMCTAPQKLSIALDTYYKQNGKGSNACDWGGKAQTVSPQATSSACSTLLGQASSSAGSSTGGGAAASSSTGAALPAYGRFDVGKAELGVVAAVGLAMMAGAGMVFW